MILDSKRRCVNVLDLDLYGCDVVNIVIVYGFACLNECVRFRRVYEYTVYYVNLLCRLVFCKLNHVIIILICLESLYL
jgi:hypothetical protein